MTSVVIDANIGLALLLPLPYSADVDNKINQWFRNKVLLMAPALWEYEVVSGLRRAEFLKIITHDNALLALSSVQNLHVEVHSPTFQNHQLAIEISHRLGHSKCYDAQYIALAKQSGAEFWTADQRLVNKSHGLGMEWVHWIGE